jgi:hypothetical protein
MDIPVPADLYTNPNLDPLTPPPASPPSGLSTKATLGNTASGLFTGPNSFATMAIESANALPETVYNAIDYPAASLRGDVDPLSDIGLGRAADAAGTVTLGGGAVPRAVPSGTTLRAGYARPKFPDMEHVTSAAIYGPDNNIYAGRMHYEIGENLPPDVRDKFWDDYNPNREGFVTNTGRFVTREEADEIARASGQIDDTLTGQRSLSSEDMLAHNFGTDEDDMLNANRSVTGAIPLFSRMEREAAAIPQPRAQGQQWSATLKNKGVPQEEIEWTGVADWLKERGTLPVTKEELLAQIGKAQTQVGVTRRGSTREKGDSTSPPWTREGETKYSNYQLPGGENYREVLLTLPDENPRLREIQDIAAEDRSVLDQAHPIRQERDRLLAEQDQNRFRSSHWDEPNVLAHMRVNDRFLPDAPEPAGFTVRNRASGNQGPRFATEQEARDYQKTLPPAMQVQTQVTPIPGRQPTTGTRVLFAEEIQSDWHQKGRREGYGGPDSPDVLALAKETAKRDSGKFETFSWETDLTDQGRARYLADAGKSLVPNAPFKKTWPDLVLKRLVADAIEGGYDAIAWTDGATQAARYDLSKQVGKVAYDPEGQRLMAWKPGDNHENWTTAIINQTGISPDKLADYIGKEAADKLVNTPTQTGAEFLGDTGRYNVLSGIDLQVGGDGMKAFYDQELPRRAKKLFGRWGAKVEDTNLGPTNYDPLVGEGHALPESAATPQIHILRITPEMRTAIQTEGLPLYANKSKAAGAGVVLSREQAQQLLDTFWGYWKNPGNEDSTRAVAKFKSEGGSSELWNHIGQYAYRNESPTAEDLVALGPLSPTKSSVMRKKYEDLSGMHDLTPAEIEEGMSSMGQSPEWTAAIARNRLPKLTVWRGTRKGEDSFDTNFAGVKPGDKISNNHNIMTSLERSTAEFYGEEYDTGEGYRILKLEIPKGTRGAAMEPGAEDMEVSLPAGTQWEVVNRTPKVITLRAVGFGPDPNIKSGIFANKSKAAGVAVMSEKDYRRMLRLESDDFNWGLGDKEKAEYERLKAMTPPRGMKGQSHSDLAEGMSYTPEEQAALDQWVGTLSGEDPPPLLQTAAERNVLPKSATLWRGTAPMGMEELWQYNVGDVVESQNITATSTDKATALSFAEHWDGGNVVRIRAPKGTRGLAIVGPGENEIVFPAGTKYHIDKMNSNGTVHLSIVDPTTEANGSALFANRSKAAGAVAMAGERPEGIQGVPNTKAELFRYLEGGLSDNQIPLVATENNPLVVLTPMRSEAFDRKSTPIVEIPVADIQTWQGTIDHDKIKPLTEDYPPIHVGRINGQLVVMNGNHRLTSAIQGGLNTIRAKYVDFNAPENKKYWSKKKRPITGGGFAAGGGVQIEVNGAVYTGSKLPGMRGRPLSTNIEDRRASQKDKVNRGLRRMIDGTTQGRDGVKGNRLPTALETLVAPPEDLYLTAPHGDEDEFRTDTMIRDGVPPSIEDLILRQGGDQFTDGLVHDPTPGRTDRLPTSMPADSYVIPADIVSGMGQGNTLAGAKILDAIFHSHGGGVEGKAEGGSVGKRIPVIVAGGEYVVSPDKVRSLGGGDPTKGHKLLDSFTKRNRVKLVKRLTSLPGPRTD